MGFKYNCWVDKYCKYLWLVYGNKLIENIYVILMLLENIYIDWVDFY